jgi:hypothetical protein
MHEACRVDLVLSHLFDLRRLWRSRKARPDHGFRVPSFTRLLPHLQEPTFHQCDSESLPII